MLGRLSHIAVVVRDLPGSLERYQRALGGKVIEQEHLPETSTDVAVVELGGAHVEFLSSSQSDSKVGRILRERGEGIHHLSFEVDNLEQRLAEAQAAGLGLLDAKPRTGLHGRRIAFLRPQDTSGVLIELVEESQQAQK